jgi:hypothetical protein
MVLKVESSSRERRRTERGGISRKLKGSERARGLRIGF